MVSTLIINSTTTNTYNNNRIIMNNNEKTTLWENSQEYLLKQQQTVDNVDEEALLVASLIVNELSFWDPTPKELLQKSHSVSEFFLLKKQQEEKELLLESNNKRISKSVQTSPNNNNNDSNNNGRFSPTLQELKDANKWQKAIDPASGRTYYYDTITRKTQWEKPREVRAIEKKMKKEQRIKDKEFFNMMELNIIASIERGEKIPNVKELPKIGAPKEPVVNTKPQRAVRTISNMNEHLLAQLQQQQNQNQPSTMQSHQQQRNNNSNSNIMSSLSSTSNTKNAPLPPLEGGRPPLPTQLSKQNVTSNNNIDQNDVDSSGDESPLLYSDNDYDYYNNNNKMELSPDTDNDHQQKKYIMTMENDKDVPLRGIDLLLNSEESDDSDEAAAATAVVAAAILNNNNNNNCSKQQQQQQQITPSTPDSKSTTTNTQLTPLSHIRRNTATGSVVPNVHSGGSMEKPNIEATIETVCCVIRAHIEQSTMTHTTPTPAPNAVRVNLELFRDDYEYNNNNNNRRYNNNGTFYNNNNNNKYNNKKQKQKKPVPTVEQIKAFYMELYKRSQMELDVIIMSLIYVERLIKETNGLIMPNVDNWSSVIFSCMILSSKVWDDLSMWNIDFSNVSVSSGLCPFSLQRINQLELAILTCLNFSVAIPASEYAKYYYLLRNMMIRGGLLNLQQQQNGNTNNNLHHSKLVEDRTCQFQDCINNNNNNHTSSSRNRRQARSVDWSMLSRSNENKDNNTLGLLQSSQQEA